MTTELKVTLPVTGVTRQACSTGKDQVWEQSCPVSRDERKAGIRRFGLTVDDRDVGHCCRDECRVWSARLVLSNVVNVSEPEAACGESQSGTIYNPKLEQ